MIESLTVTNFYCFKERTTILFTAKKERNRMLDGSSSNLVVISFFFTGLLLS